MASVKVARGQVAVDSRGDELVIVYACSSPWHGTLEARGPGALAALRDLAECATAAADALEAVTRRAERA